MIQGVYCGSRIQDSAFIIRSKGHKSTESGSATLHRINFHPEELQTKSEHPYEFFQFWGIMNLVYKLCCPEKGFSLLNHQMFALSWLLTTAWEAHSQNVQLLNVQLPNVQLPKVLITKRPYYQTSILPDVQLPKVLITKCPVYQTSSYQTSSYRTSMLVIITKHPFFYFDYFL